LCDARLRLLQAAAGNQPWEGADKQLVNDKESQKGRRLRLLQAALKGEPVKEADMDLASYMNIAFWDLEYMEIEHGLKDIIPEPYKTRTIIVSSCTALIANSVEPYTFLFPASFIALYDEAYFGCKSLLVKNRSVAKGLAVHVDFRNEKIQLIFHDARISEVEARMWALAHLLAFNLPDEDCLTIEMADSIRDDHFIHAVIRETVPHVEYSGSPFEEQVSPLFTYLA
jgi:hypothetical protein